MKRTIFAVLVSAPVGHLLAGLAVLGGLLATRYWGNYLLFHSLVEVFSTVVAFGIFTVFWNARRFLDNGCFLFLGIAYLFIGGIDLLHALAYEKMGVFGAPGPNLATQLWIGGRFVESLSMLAAPLFLHRRFNPHALLIGYAAVVSLLLGSIFYWGVFPDCFVEGEGLTPFKLASEYVISGILIASLVLLYRHRSELDAHVYHLLTAAIALTIFAELTFTTYQGVTDVRNMVGHFFKLVSFYLIYVAFVEVGLTNPYAVLFRNLTESEASLRQSEARFRGTFDNAAVGIAHVDLDGRWLLVNSRLCEMLRFSREEILRKTLHELTQAEDRAGDVGQFSALVGGEVGSYSREQRYLRRDGDAVWVNLTMALNRDSSGQPLYAIAVIQDIAKRKDVERELRLVNETLEHRISERTALAERQAAQLRLLASELTLAEQRERRRLGQILHDHLQQLLAAAKLKIRVLERRSESGKPPEPLRQVNDLLNQAIEASRSLTVELSPPILYDGGLAAALEWLGRQMQEKHDLKVEVQVEEVEEADTEDLRVFVFQAVRELLFNVAKHASVEEVRLEVAESGEGELRVSVIDRGVGFEPASLETRDVSDAGFGLFSVRQRLKLMGGRLQIESAPGRGTRVSIWMPYHESRRSGDVGREAGEVGGTAPRPETSPRGWPAVSPAVLEGAPIRVLVADDHQLLREGLLSLLRDHGDIQVVGEATNGDEAVEAALRTCPDVVVMDVAMPGLTGIEATRRITSALPLASVIGLSMHEEAAMAETMRRAGAFDYLPKGGPVDELIAAIRAAAASKGASGRDEAGKSDEVER